MSKPNPLMAAESPVKFFILLALERAPTHGSDIIMQVLSDSAVSILIPKSTIYDILRELEAGGFVQSKAPERATAPREYSLTPDGRDALRKALSMYENAVRLGRQRLRECQFYPPYRGRLK